MYLPDNRRWQALALPKKGHEADEYEDACAAAPEAGRFALADGASESSFAGLWARLLAEGFVQAGREALAGDGWLEPLRREWARAVDGRPLPWYAEAKRRQGAFATFLGLVLQPADKAGGRWQAVAQGDSCLFQVRDSQLLTAFPVKRSQDFGSAPALVGARPQAPPAVSAPCQHAGGTWAPGDCFLLMTDALAQWFLERCEAGGRPWQTLARLLADPTPDQAFARWIEELRRHALLRNDDVTLLPLIL